MDNLHDILDDQNLQMLDELIQSGALNQVDEKEEEDLKASIINLVTTIQFAPNAHKSFARKALARILRRSPDHMTVYNIPCIMAANFKQTDVVLALMLKGGSPSKVNPDFLRPFLNQHNEGVSPLLREIAEIEFNAHRQGKSFRSYAEEQRKTYSLEEVLERLEGQDGGRRHPRHRSHRKKGSRHHRRTHHHRRR